MGWRCSASGGEAEAIREAHATYYLARAAKAELQMSGPQQISLFKPDSNWSIPYLGGPMSWCSFSHTSQFASRAGPHIGAVLGQDGGYAPARDGDTSGWKRKSLSISRGVRSAGRTAKALIGAGRIKCFQDDFGQAEAWCREGFGAAPRTGDCQGSAAVLLIWGYAIWGYAAMMRGSYTQARSRLEEALALFREEGGPGPRCSRPLCSSQMPAVFSRRLCTGTWIA